MEDLNCHTYGTKKALAKAIESMADEISLYAREVYAVKLHTGRNCELVTQSAYNTSTIHVNCGGKLERDEDNYDIAPCLKCSEMVNTHVNSVFYQINQYKFASVHSPEANL